MIISLMKGMTWNEPVASATTGGNGYYLLNCHEYSTPSPLIIISYVKNYVPDPTQISMICIVIICIATTCGLDLIFLGSPTLPQLYLDRVYTPHCHYHCGLAYWIKFFSIVFCLNDYEIWVSQQLPWTWVTVTSSRPLFLFLYRIDSL